MVITTNMTSKGQATIPKAVRELLGLRLNQKIDFVIDKKTKEVKIKAKKDIFDFLEELDKEHLIEINPNFNIRKEMEENYERV